MASRSFGFSLMSTQRTLFVRTIDVLTI